MNLNNNNTYRWGGTDMAEISPSLALGETSTTAYRGDRGKTAYDHSQATHARTDANNSDVAWDSTNKRITKTVNGTTTNVVTANTIIESATSPANSASQVVMDDPSALSSVLPLVVEKGLYATVNNKTYGTIVKPTGITIPYIDKSTGAMKAPSGIYIGANGDNQLIGLSTTITVGNASYTVSQLLNAMVGLMDKNVVYQPASS